MVLSKDARALVKKLYYNPKHGFNVEKVYKVAKKSKYKKEITHKAIREWLKSQQVVGRFQRKKEKVKRHYLVKRPDQQWQIDTMYLNLKAKPPKKYASLKEARKHATPFIVCVDVFSKHVMIKRVPNLKGKNPLNALKYFIKKSGKPKSIYVDKGKEFKSHWKKYCKDNGIQLIFAIKLAPIVERMNRTIKSYAEMYRKAFKQNIGIFMDDIVENINSTTTRTTGMTPNKAETGRHNKEVFKNLMKYLGPSTDVTNLKVGDKVRIKKFQKIPHEEQ